MTAVNEDFAGFMEDFGPAIDKRSVPTSTIDRYRGKLPDQLLGYWAELGWCGYADGLFWTVNPQDYEPVLDAWIGDTEFMERDAYHVIGKSAFGELYFWGEKTGQSLKILPLYALAFPTAGSEKYIAEGKTDEALRWFFGALQHKYFDMEDEHEKLLFAHAMKALSPLSHDEIYGFVPALALGGPATLKTLRKVEAVEHLVLLSHLSPLRIMKPSWQTE